MKKLKPLNISFILLIVFATTVSVHAQDKATETYEICVYGGSSAGVIAAYTAKKMGKTVILIEPGNRLGGLTSGGLGQTDIGNKYAVYGVSVDFYRRIGKAYTMDSHSCQRLVVDGRVKNEGNVQIGGFDAYPISYRSVIPKAAECKNLLVPVCLSTSHIAYGSIRMEPVFMVLGQSSAVAASIAIDRKKFVQEIDFNQLKIN